MLTALDNKLTALDVEEQENKAELATYEQGRQIAVNEILRANLNAAASGGGGGGGGPPAGAAGAPDEGALY